MIDKAELEERLKDMDVLSVFGLIERELALLSPDGIKNHKRDNLRGIFCRK